MQIGLIGGIGPAATDYYHRRLIAQFRARGAPLELTIVHADTPTLLANQARDDQAAQVAIYRRLTERLAAAGAGCVVVTSIAGHFCIDAFKTVSPLPVIDLLEVVDAAVAARGLKRLGVLGTRVVMETGLYGGLRSAETHAPAGASLQAVHDAYVAMAAAGAATADHRAVFETARRAFFDPSAPVDAVLLGGTDLALVYDAETAPFPIVDCAAIHVDAIVSAAAPAS